MTADRDICSTADVEQVPALVRELYAATAQLQALFPSRKFTLDGHLVGSVGEVIASA